MKHTVFSFCLCELVVVSNLFLQYSWFKWWWSCGIITWRRSSNIG